MMEDKKKKQKVYQKTREGEQCGHGHGNQTWLEQDLGRVSGLASGKMPKDGFFYARLTSGGGGCLAMFRQNRNLEEEAHK